MENLLDFSSDDPVVEQIRTRFRRAGNSPLMLGLQEALIRRQCEQHLVPDTTPDDEQPACRSRK